MSASGGGLLPGGCLLLGGGWGWSAPGGGWSAPGGGCLLQGVGVVVSQHALRQTPSPPPWTESQTPVKTLPWPNFIAAGKNKLVTYLEYV